MRQRFLIGVTNASIDARMRIARAARYRMRRSVRIDDSDRTRRASPIALGERRRYPHFLLASLWRSWVCRAQAVDPPGFCRASQVSGN
ncbi:hypothetical protein C7S17_4776 [Burkholderia thailandensis]|nr:hypothetical protein [Burkholderia thailandensis]